MKIELLATHTRGGFCVRRKMQYAENNSIPSVKYGGGSFMLRSYFASTGPGALVKDILAKNLIAFARRLKLGCK
jgi:hypothetical protein